MLIQIALGSVLMMGTILLAGLTVWLLEASLRRNREWLIREPQRLKLVLAVMAISLWALATISAGVWLWATTLYHLGALSTMEEAVYFTLVTFTTLGYGDVILTPEWRVLGGLAAVNGMLNIGVLTAMMIETTRSLRQLQLGYSDN